MKMKLHMQKPLTDAEWEKIVAFGPGVRMYKGKKTLFYIGEILWEGDAFGRPLIYDREERDSWETLIVLPGVVVIPELTFRVCMKLKTVIMADTVKRIEKDAFEECYSLQFVTLSRNLEYIGAYAFQNCYSLTSIFIPPSCREIADVAFDSCKKLIILSIPPHTQLGDAMIAETALFEASPLYNSVHSFYLDDSQVNTWIKTINDGETLALHRICSSDTPNTEQIYRVVTEHGLRAMKHPNSIGITPSQYLAANPYSDIEEDKLVKRYVLEMMGEVV